MVHGSSSLVLQPKEEPGSRGGERWEVAGSQLSYLVVGKGAV